MAAASPSPLAPAAQEVPPPPRFDIARFDVQGNTLLSTAEIEAAVSRFSGKSKDFADVQRALESLQNRYRSRGYGTVQVLLPEQELDRGVIVFRVIEPRLGKVTVEGNKFFDAANIRRSMPALKEGVVPNAHDIGADARIANENPAKRTTVLLRAGENENEVNATIRVQDERPWRAAVSLDNTGTPTSGKHRLGVAFQHSNLFDRDHTLTMQYQLDPEPLKDFDQLKILGIGYRIPLYGYSATIDLLAGYSSLGATTGQTTQSPTGQSSPVTFSGSGKIFGVRYNRMLPRPQAIDDYEHRVTLGLDYKAFENPVVRQELNFGFNEAPDVTVHPLSLAYSANKRMQNAQFDFFASFAYNFYPHGSDASSERFSGMTPLQCLSAMIPPTQCEGAARGVGRAKYRVWRYGFNYLRALSNDVQLRMNVTGQWTPDALIAGEQFGIGGWDNVRGMLEREAAADRGIRGALEIYSPDIAGKMGWEGGRLRLLAFVDSGALRPNFKDTCPTCRVNATSAGVGMRMALRNGLSLRLDYAHMIDGGPESTSSESRVHFGLAVAF